MHKSAIAQRFFLIVFILLSGCGGTPDVQLLELSSNPVSYDDTIHINNCGGKAESEQTASRSFATTIDGGAEFKAGYEMIVEGGISAKYSQYRNVSKSMRLIAPSGTNMQFVLRWSEEVHAGNVTIGGATGTYEARVPISVEQVSSQDLGCSDIVQIQPTSSGETVSQFQELPTTPDEAARKWGGQSQWWEKLSTNGWKLRGTLTLTVENGWRIDYTDTNGNIKSCGDKFEPGVYGSVTVNVVEATLWYVPGETKCPSWTVWSQSHP
ncbi:MAG: hypothetical protein AABZ00_05880 [Chloroflexota bacterium]